MSEILKEAQKRYKASKEDPFEEKLRDPTDLFYFTGEDQGWDKDGARARLEEERRPALTLNRINPIIRLMCGARPKTEARYSAVEDGDVETSSIFNELKVHVEDHNRWEFEGSEWFKNGIIKSREVVEIRPDYKRDKLGEIELSRRDGLEFYLDNNSKRKDRADMEFMFEEISCTPAKAKRLFPKFANDIDSFVNIVKGGSEGSQSRDSGNPDEYADVKSNYWNSGDKKIIIPRYWYKEYTSTKKIIDRESGEIFEEDEIDKEIFDAILKAVKGMDRFNIMEIEHITVKYLTFIHDIELENGVNPWERPDRQPTTLSENFPFVFFEPERIHAGARHELLTVINPLHDPQRFHNKLASAVIEIIGTGTKTGVDFEEGALTPTMAERFKKLGTKAGAAIEWTKGAISGGKFKYRNSTSNPQAEMLQAREMADSLLNISGVESLISTDSLGKNASGLAVDLKQRQGGNIISWVYESFRFFQYQLTEYVTDAIQVLYNYEKVIRIRGDKQKFITINEEVYDQTGGISEVLNNVTIGKYDFKIVEKDIMPSIRLERFRSFVELAKSGALAVPPEVMTKIILHLLDDPELKDIVEESMSEFYEMGGGMGQPGQEGQPAAMPMQ